MSKTKVILLQNVAKVGTKYDIKEVASGFARNFLIASKKATIASREALKSLEKWKEGAVKEMALKYDQFSKEVAKFDDLVLTIKAKANEEGNLYGAIHAENIAEGLLKDFSLNIDFNYNTLPKINKLITPILKLYNSKIL